jgi:hypothetical protein
MYRIPKIITTIIVRRLEWAGHLVRTSDDGTVKKVFLGKPEGRRKPGRPIISWLGCIENDLEITGVERGRKQAKDRFPQAIIMMATLVKLQKNLYQWRRRWLFFEDSKFGIYIENPHMCKNINKIFKGKLLEFQE